MTNIIDKFSSAVEKFVRPATLPIAIKLLEREDDVPSDMKRPKRDFGLKLIPCQAFYLSRKSEVPLAMLKEDFNTDVCPLGSIAFGMAPPIDWWSKGNISFEVYVKDWKAAEEMERNVFRFEYGRYAGILLAPLSKVNFNPDMVMIYCNSEQAMSLIIASRYDDGLPITTTISARGVCSDSVVQTIQTGKCHVCISCGGDRNMGKAESTEIVFTSPINKLQPIIDGLTNISKNRAPAVPKQLILGEDKRAKRYIELARLLKAS